MDDVVKRRLNISTKLDAKFCQPDNYDLSRNLKMMQFGTNLMSSVVLYISFGGLMLTCSPRDPGFSGSSPAEVDGFFQDVKILSPNPPEGILNRGFRV